VICSYIAKHVMTFILGCVRISDCVIFCRLCDLEAVQSNVSVLITVGYATEDNHFGVLLLSCIPGCFIGYVHNIPCAEQAISTRVYLDVLLVW